ncbi:MAG: hypothetical protein HYZ34_10315 [Ignavibacteriae bacterium]|nr:hypothetical protein [Ignavibacteriota bacterium]
MGLTNITANNAVTATFMVVDNITATITTAGIKPAATNQLLKTIVTATFTVAEMTK